MHTIGILVTGDPIEPVRAIASGFDAMVRDAAGPAAPVDFCSVDARAPGALPSATAFDAFILTGSPHSVTERLPWMLALEELVRACARCARPVLGLCFGHQLIGSALGGAVTRNPRGYETGLVTASPIAQDDALPMPAEPFAVLMAHEDTVARLPTGAVVLAKTERDEHAAVRFAPACWGVQFHPEFSPEVERKFVRARFEVLRAQGQAPEEVLSSVRETPRSRELLRAFCRWVAAGPDQR